MYLGATLSIMEADGIQGWCMSSDKYVKAAVENVKQELARANQQLPSKCRTPMTVGYRPERDISAARVFKGTKSSLVCYAGPRSLAALTSYLKLHCSRHIWHFHERGTWSKYIMCLGI